MTIEKTLHVGFPNLGNKEQFLRRLDRIWESHRLTNNGPFVEEFERAICGLLGVEHAVAVCNATTGLQIVARVLMPPGEVVVPGFTFVATAHALTWVGFKPVFCDIDPKTHLLDLNALKRVLHRKTMGIVGVHVWGVPCYVEELEEIAGTCGVALIFDAAHAFGCTHKLTHVGNFGNAEVFSFHATKFLNSFEGGVITTKSEMVAEACRMVRNFGFVGYDQVPLLGTNGKMTEVCAAMGLTSLEAMEGILVRNGANYWQYATRLCGIPGIRFLNVNLSNDEQRNYQYVVIEVEEGFGVTRDELCEHLWKEGVLARKYFYPGVHRMMPYWSERRALPKTEEVSKRVLVLPTGYQVTASDVDRVCSLIKERANG